MLNIRQKIKSANNVVKAIVSSVYFSVLSSILVVIVLTCVILPDVWNHLIPLQYKVNSSYLDLVCVTLISYMFITKNIDKRNKS